MDGMDLTCGHFVNPFTDNWIQDYIRTACQQGIAYHAP